MFHTLPRPPVFRICGAVVFATVTAGLMVHLGASERPVGQQAGSAAASTPERIRIKFELLGTPPDQPTGRVGAQSFIGVGPGDRRTEFAFADVLRTGHLCATGVGSRASDDVGVRWKVELELLEASAGRAAIAINWTRARWRDGVFSEEAHGRHTVRLDLGQRQVLDYVADPESSDCASVLLQITPEAVPAVDPQATLVFDLWLEYEGRLGHRWEHKQVTARSGVQTPFKFEDMGWAVGGDSAAAGPGPFLLRVSGTVFGRLRADGFVDIALRAERWLWWVDGGRGGRGELDYRAALGEAAEVLLPEPSGTTRRPYASVPAIATPGLSYSDGVWVLDVKEFLDGQLRLYVAATRQP